MAPSSTANVDDCQGLRLFRCRPSRPLSRPFRSRPRRPTSLRGYCEDDSVEMAKATTTLATMPSADGDARDSDDDHDGDCEAGDEAEAREHGDADEMAKATSEPCQHRHLRHQQRPSLLGRPPKSDGDNIARHENGTARKEHSTRTWQGTNMALHAHDSTAQTWHDDHGTRNMART